MDTLKQKLSSRKFIAYLGAVLVVLGSFAQGLIDSTALITGLVTATAAYQTSEAIADHGRGSAQ